MRSEDPFAFGPYEEKMKTILRKLSGLKPCMYLETFNYDERVTLLTVLIDNIHDTNEFRMFLNKRIENKAVFNKEKMDYYMQIRELESKQAEMNRTM